MFWARPGAGPPTEDQPARAALTLSDLSEDVLVGAVAEAKRRWSDATVARMLSTLRGFTRWLRRCGHLVEDPLDGDLFRAPATAQRRPRAPEGEDVERMLVAAGEKPRPRQRMFWTTRDVALDSPVSRPGPIREKAWRSMARRWRVSLLKTRAGFGRRQHERPAMAPFTVVVTR